MKMLARFATGAPFNADCKGGGRESNGRFLPFMIQMASHLLDQGASNQQHRQALVKSVAAYLSSSPPPSASPARPSSTSPSPARSSAGSSSDETIQFMMVNSLLSESYESWSQHRLGFLQRGIYHAYMQHKHGKPPPLRFPEASPGAARAQEGSSPDAGDGAKLFAVVRPMLVYAGLIEQLQRFFKLGGGSETGSLEGGSSEVERWEVVMKERLVNVKEMVGLSKELLSCLGDMTSAVDLQEAFDVMGVLGDVLSAGFSSSEDFVNASISSATY